MSTSALEQAKVLAQMSQFRDFLQGPQASLLLIDGYCSSKSVGNVSPLSVFCAGVASGLLQSRMGVVIQFYCGENTDLSRPLGGPQGLLRSCICQLLLSFINYTPDLSFLDEHYLDALRKRDISVLWLLFESMLIQYGQHQPMVPVYLIIDNVSEFEGSVNGFGLQMHLVIDGLRRLIDGCNHGVGGALLKVFLTNAERSISLVDKVDRRTEHISLLSGERFGGELILF
jgi:hypothetical protein